MATPILPGNNGFMITAGNARNNQGPNGQRSNAVLLAATDRGVFDFSAETKPDPKPNGPVTVTLETLHADLQTLIAMVRELKR